jgi:hypothetical protein
MFHRCPLYIPLFCFWIHGTRFTYIVVTLTHCQYLSIISCILNQFFIVVTGVVQAWSCYVNRPCRMRWRGLVTKCFETCLCFCFWGVFNTVLLCSQVYYFADILLVALSFSSLQYYAGWNFLSSCELFLYSWRNYLI